MHTMARFDVDDERVRGGLTMKVRPDPKNGNVVITMTAREAMSLANRLVRAAIASGAPENSERQESTDDEGQEEREG
jgi:hypothetical protein